MVTQTNKVMVLVWTSEVPH